MNCNRLSIEFDIEKISRTLFVMPIEFLTAVGCGNIF